MKRTLQDKISNIETLILLNQPPLTLLKIQSLATNSHLTDLEYLRYLEFFINNQ